MSAWLVRLALAGLVLRVVGWERIANLVRWADQRLDLFSPRGASLYARIAPRVLAPLYRTIAEEASASGARSVLDVGTGPGALAVEIARHADARVVVGVDIAPEMLATAGRRATEAHVAERVEFVVADAAALPMAEGSVDLVVSSLSLHHWADPAGVLRELHRVVRPGGSVILHDVRFSYSPRQFAEFVAGGPFANAGFSYRTLAVGPVPLALFARYELTKRRARRGDDENARGILR